MRLVLIISAVLLCGLGVGWASTALTAQYFQTIEPVPSASDRGKVSQRAESELQKGISLTRGGRFARAIPHLEAARGHVRESYAASFNLALCNVGIGKFKLAIQVLKDLQQNGYNTAGVNNLFAQAYIGAGHFSEGWSSFEKAAAMTPNDEKLYVFVTDAFTAKQNYTLGLKVVNLGLKKLPSSARLHYQRGMLLTLTDKFDLGKKDFQSASLLAPGSTVSYLATAQRNFLEGDIGDTIHVAREGIHKGHDDYRLLAILGEALIRFGIAPGQQEFKEAESALERSVVLQPDYSSAQIALGKLYLMENRLDDAILHLETGRSLRPDETSAYASLSVAYRRKGEIQHAQRILAILERLNQEQVARIGTPSGGRRSGYGLSPVEPAKTVGKFQSH